MEQMKDENDKIELNQTKGGGQYSHEDDHDYLERQRRYAPCVDINSMRIVKSRGSGTAPVGAVGARDEEQVISEKLKIISKARAL